MDYMDHLKADLVLFANDLTEYQNSPAGKKVLKAFYASAWNDYDLPESKYFADEMGSLPSAEAIELTMLLNQYWNERI